MNQYINSQTKKTQVLILTTEVTSDTVSYLFNLLKRIFLLHIFTAMLTNNKSFNLDGNNFPEMMDRDYNLTQNSLVVPEPHQHKDQQSITKTRLQIPDLIRISTNLEYNPSTFLSLSSSATPEPAVHTLDVNRLPATSDKLPNVPPVNTPPARSILPSRTTEFVRKLLSQTLLPSAAINDGAVCHPSVKQKNSQSYNARGKQSFNSNHKTISLVSVLLLSKFP